MGKKKINNKTGQLIENILSGFLGGLSGPLFGAGNAVQKNENPSPHSNRPGYTCIFQYGDKDLSSRIESIQIINSSSTIYPIFLINVNMDSKDVQNIKLYGKEECYIELRFNDPNFSELEKYTADLMVLYIDSNLGLKRNDYQPDFAVSEPIQLLCLPSKCFRLMSTPITKFIKQGEDKKAIEIIEEIVQEISKNVSNNLKVNIDKKNISKDKIFQWVIPYASSLIKCIRNLDSNFGIYNGVMFVYSDITDNNDVNFYLHDLSKVMEGGEIYKVTFISIDSTDESEKNGKNHFYSTNPIKLLNNATGNSVYNGNNQIVVDKPRDKFMNIKKFSMDKIQKENGVMDGNNKELYFNEFANSRITFHSRGISGGEGSDSFITSAISQWLSSCTQLEITLNGSVYINNLLKIGKPMMFDPIVEDYKKFAGKFIIGSSDISLRRSSSGNFDTNVKIRVFRANIEN